MLYSYLPDNCHIAGHFVFWSDVTVYRFNLAFITLNVDHSDLSVYMQGVGYIRIVGVVPEFGQGRDAYEIVGSIVHFIYRIVASQRGSGKELLLYHTVGCVENTVTVWRSRWCLPGV